MTATISPIRPEVSRTISVTDTAKLVRQALKAAFPDTKFSVRSESYSMGASITVRWVDGPSAKAVEAVVNGYEGAEFDGYTDCKSHVARMVDGVKTYYGADYIFCTRSFSVEFAQRIADELADQHGVPWITVKPSKYDGTAEYAEAMRVRIGDDDLCHLITMELGTRPYTPPVAE